MDQISGSHDAAARAAAAVLEEAAGPVTFTASLAQRRAKLLDRWAQVSTVVSESPLGVPRVDQAWRAQLH